MDKIREVEVVEVKFILQISGLPLTGAHLGNCIFVYLHDFGQIGGGGSANQTNLQIYHKSLYKIQIGSWFIKKITNSCIWGSRMQANKRWRLPIGPKCTNFEFFWQFQVQNLNSTRVYFMETNWHLLYSGFHGNSHFGLMNTSQPAKYGRIIICWSFWI